ncbi:hypothetical protein D9V34_09380 [Mycetocola lacteus]|uniref:Uncharacterized protein n=1 Tax=Mycetocola lacteus TaxID=76637 RepID=A0A3L7APX9_9MICO|nr:hypothetical protein [Mycetocola lacteus]RLP82025.1 hypothetical protein D9V34_09380 [Mycetocola lacteus]
MDTSTRILNRTVDVRLEIDFPLRFDETVVQDIDQMLENLNLIDTMARNTIRGALTHSSSTPATVFRQWLRQSTSSAPSPQDFMDELVLSGIRLYPDGGRTNRVRIELEYQSPIQISPRITVQFLERTGPELLPARR